MSVYAYAYIWSTSKERGSSLITLLALADFADQDTGICTPGIPRLAQMARMSERNMQLLLRKLESKGLIAIEAHKGMQTNGGNTNRYTLKGYAEWRKGVKDISPRQEKGGEISSTKVVKNRAKGGEIAISPEPSLEPSLEPKEGARKRATPPKPQKVKKPGYNIKRWSLEQVNDYWTAHQVSVCKLVTAWGYDESLCGTMSDSEKRTFITANRDLLAASFSPDNYKSLVVYARAKSWKKDMPVTDLAGFVTEYRNHRLTIQAPNEKTPPPLPTADPKEFIRRLTGQELVIAK